MSGWKKNEDEFLIKLAKNVQENNGVMIRVFESVAQKLNRKKDSVRNRYYFLLKNKINEKDFNEKLEKTDIIEFSDSEKIALIKEIFYGKRQGKSVRKILMEIACNDATKMLRFQNKYRNMLKNESDFIEKIENGLIEKERKEEMEGTLKLTSTKKTFSYDEILFKTIESMTVPTLNKKLGVYSKDDFLEKRHKKKQ